MFDSGRDRTFDRDIHETGLYVHVPFCRTMCRFCPYFKERYDPALIDSYTDAVLKEIRAVGERCDRPSVTSVYYGGGTPVLVGKRLHTIQKQIHRYFNVAGSQGIELHPDNVRSDTAAFLSDAGLTMVSLGMQSFQDRCLRALGRDPTDLSDRITEIRKASIRVVDVDLIFGIPGQTVEDIARDFRFAASKGATQISTYPFIDFSFAPNPTKPLGRKRKRELLNTILEVSDEVGFARTSVWTFTKNCSDRYSSVTRDSYIGFGPSAATLLRSSFSINVFSVEEYIRAIGGGKSPTALLVNLTDRERALFWLFWNAYSLRIPRKRFTEIFGDTLESVFGFELYVAGTLGLIKRRDDSYEVTRRGAYLFHIIEQLYTDQYIDKVWRISRTTPWPQKLVLR